MSKYLTLFLVFLTAFQLKAQSDTTDFDLAKVVYLDSFVVVATRSGFDVPDFIDMVKKDDSFLKAFHHLRKMNYISDTDIKMFSKKGKEKAGYKVKAIQTYENKCMSMTFPKEEASGNFYKNKRKRKHRYYTGQIFDDLFLVREKTCNQDDIQQTGINAFFISELYKLVFKPGTKASIPSLSSKTAIFSKKMSKYYDYAITSKKYKDTIDTYVFSVKVKPEYINKDRVVITKLETYFDKSTFQVVARDYFLKNNTITYDFDVHMYIELIKVNDKYYPELVIYEGMWDVPFKKPEICELSTFFEIHP